MERLKKLINAATDSEIYEVYFGVLYRFIAAIEKETTMFNYEPSRERKSFMTLIRTANNTYDMNYRGLLIRQLHYGIVDKELINDLKNFTGALCHE